MMLVVCFALATLAVIGCGSGDAESLGRVSGMVTLDGSPKPGIIVNFAPIDGGRPSGGQTDETGKFELIYSPRSAGAIVGKHTVQISADGELAKQLSNSDSPLILKKELTVESGNNSFELELKDFQIEERKSGRS